MINKEQIKEWVESYLKDTDYQLQTLEIDNEQNILVEIDRLGVVDVDFCAELNRYLVAQLGDEDFSLEVGSVSLTAPFVSKIQYQKNLGHEVEVIVDSRKTATLKVESKKTAALKEQAIKYHGILVSVDEETFAIDTEVMVAVEGKKRKVKETQTLEFRYDEAETRYELKV